MYKQSTPEEYDTAFLEAERDLAIISFESDDDDVMGREFTTKKSFFKDLRKVSQRIKKAKVSPKPSTT